MRREHGQFYCGARYYCPASFCLSRTGFNMAAVPGDARASLLVPSCVIRVSSGWDHSDPGEKAGKGMEVVRIFCYRVLDWSASFIHPNFSLHPQVWSSPSTPPPFSIKGTENAIYFLWSEIFNNFWLIIGHNIRNSVLWSLFFLIYIVDVNWVHFKVQIHTFHLIEVNMFDLMDLNG